MSSDLRIDWCSHEAALHAVRHWHYSRSLPPPPHNRLGVWEAGEFVGCVLFARGASASLLKPYGLTTVQGCELVRVALAPHRAPVSRIVAIAIRLVTKRAPRLRLIVSFADPAEGHVGAIYQAMGWLYAGRTSDTTEYIGPDGKRWHPRMISVTGRRKVYGRVRRVLTPEQCRAITRPGKHRYLLALDGDMRRRIAPLARPYPKRGQSREIAAAPPRAEGGVIPTCPLQSS